MPRGVDRISGKLSPEERLRPDIVGGTIGEFVRASFQEISVFLDLSSEKGDHIRRHQWVEEQLIAAADPVKCEIEAARFTNFLQVSQEPLSADIVARTKLAKSLENNICLMNVKRIYRTAAFGNEQERRDGKPCVL